MKKLITILIFAAAVLVSGCDTTETTTIRINLGSDDRASSPPDDVLVVYIAVYTQKYTVEFWEIDELVVAVAAPATGVLSVVVPKGRELFVMVMALNSDKTFLYYGEGVYPGETGESLTGYVTIPMNDAELAASGTFVTNPTGDYQNLVINWWNEWPGFSDTMMSLLQMRIEKGASVSDSVEAATYNLIHREAFDVFTYLSSESYSEDLGAPLEISDGVLWYRMRLEIPVFGLIVPAGDAAYFEGPGPV